MYKYLILSGLVFFQVLFGGVPTAFCGDSPSFIFQHNQRAILSQTRCIFEGYVFATGVAQSIRPNFSSLDRARQKARLKAQGNLAVAEALDRSAWPERFRVNAVGERLARQLAQTEAGAIKVLHLQSVYDNCQDWECRVVVAAPIEDLQRYPQVAWPALVQRLNHAFSTGSLPISLYDYLEICDSKQAGDVLDLVEKKITTTYGVFAGDVVGDRLINKVPTLWGRGKRLAASKVSTLGREDLFRLLNLDPYDPVVLYYLAKSYEDNGQYRFASILYSRGTKWFIDEEYCRLCLAAAKKNDVYIDGREWSAGEASRREKVIARYAQFFELRPGIMSLLVQSFGTLPFANMDAETVVPVVNSENLRELIEEHPGARTFAAVAEYFNARGEIILAEPVKSFV